MRIKNETDWDTADLRRIFALVLTRWNKIDDRKVPSKRLRNVTVVNAKWVQYPTGHAYLNSGTIRLRLPRRIDEHVMKRSSYGSKYDHLIRGTEMKDFVRRVAFLFEHELAHAAGYDHNRMGPLNHWVTATTSRYDYVDGLEIRKKEVKVRPKADVQVVRYQAATAALQRWESKLKRAQTGIRTYRAKVRYYEKALAADGRLAALKK